MKHTKKLFAALLLLALCLSLAACSDGDSGDSGDGGDKSYVGGRVEVGSNGGDSKDEDADFSGTDRTDTEVGGGYHGSLEWLRHWSGDWYGWWQMTDGTGIYADIEDGGIWDACARIEAYENMGGYMELWDSYGSYDDLIAGIDLSFANPDDTQYGVLCCHGGQFLGNELEDGAWYVNPNEFEYDNILEFVGEYENEYGSFSYRVLLRPWGTLWDDMGDEYCPKCYYDWYLPLVEADKTMPDYIG